MKKKTPEAAFLTKVTRADEIRTMSSTLTWPHFVLPIKRYVVKSDGFRELQTGILNGNGPTVFLVNMYALGSEQFKGKRLTDLPHTKYASFEEIVDSGWVVD